MADSKGLQAHNKAELARESEDFLGSLKYLDEAVVNYVEEKNYDKLAESFGSRFLVLRHLYNTTKADVYKLLALRTIEDGVKIAEKYASESGKALPYLSMAKAMDDFNNDYPKAIEYYKKSLEILRNNPPADHDFPGHTSYVSLKLSRAEYLNGDESAIDRVEEAIKNILEMKDHPYEKDVWASGGYMYLAELMREKDPPKAKGALQKAEEIINSNPKLTIRKRQLEELKKQLSGR